MGRTSTALSGGCFWVGNQGKNRFWQDGRIGHKPAVLNGYNVIVMNRFWR